jgi:autotransporter translocation and assembly factor TamB
MPDTKPPASTPAPKKRGRFRRWLRWFGILLLVLAIFHRPLFHAGVRLLLIQVAAKQNVELDVAFSGNIFTNLTVSGIRATPTGKAPSPVRRIEIESVRLDYSLVMLAKHGVGEFLRSYEVHNAHLELEAMPSKSEPERKQKRALAEDLNNLLGQPAAYADRVHIENFNITVRAEKSVTQITGFHLFLDPQAPGYLRVQRMQIPGIPVWENLQAETSYEKRNFYIKNLQLAPELLVESLNFDASRRAQDKGSVDLRARVFGGALHFSLSGSQLDSKGKNLDKSYATTLVVEGSEISLENAAAYFGAPKPPVARLARLAVRFTGEPEKPRTWDGTASARIEALTFDKTRIDGVEFAAKFTRGAKAELSGVNIAAGKNSVGLTATVGLPDSVNDFPLSDVDAMLKLDAPDLAALTAMLPDPLTGSISGGGPIKLSNGWVSTELALRATTVAGKAFAIEGAKISAKVNKRITPAGGAPFDDLGSQIQAEVTAVRAGDFTVDSVRLDMENQNDLVTLRTVEVRRAENSISAKGTYRVPRDLRQAGQAPVDAEFSLQLPKLDSFGIKVKDATLAGHLEGRGTLKLINQSLNGNVTIEGGDFQLGEYRAVQLAMKATIADNLASIEQLALQFNATDQLGITGEVGVQKPFPYEAALLLDVKDLATFQPLLDLLGVKKSITGTLHLDWAGKGEAARVTPPLAPTLEHTGTMNFALTKGRFDKIDLTEIKLGGLYGPGFAQFSDLRLVSGPTSFSSTLEMKENKIRLKDMRLTQSDLTVLTGFVFLPVDLERLNQPIPLDQRIAANINATDLDLDKLLGSFGQTSPAAGTVTANLVTGGTLLQPFGHLRVAGRKLKSKAVAKLDAADLDLDLHYSSKELTLNAVVKQPQIQPLTIKGQVPLDLEATVKNAKLDPTLPLDISIQLPPSSLAVVPTLVPKVRRIDGTLGLDVRVTGTVNKPVLSGTAALDLTNARMDDENIPAIRAFKARLGFRDDTLTFNTFEGELGGGTFKLSGNVKLPTLTAPVFDLRAVSDEVLVKRDDAITVRADADVRVVGPLAGAAVTGTVFVTHSRFFKEIDILPIAMPGKAKPAPKTARAINTGVSFPAPPLRDWKFDLAIKTRPGDSFLIRGNLANGAAALDLYLKGTGLAPYLEGSVRIEEFKASLPFSTLTISRGFIYFKKDAPFQPSLEIQADSQARDYLVHAYIYGSATDPEIQLSSEPPLPYSDIVSLLATGTTASELTGSADVLASKAAMLAVQQLYRKIFLKGKAPAVDKQSDNDFLDRFQFELGALDSRTGGQQVVSRVRLTDQLYLIGDLGTEGGFTGRLKYLIRFR